MGNPESSLKSFNESTNSISQEFDSPQGTGVPSNVLKFPTMTAGLRDYVPGGIGRRFVANFVDSLIMFIGSAVLGFGAAIFLGACSHLMGIKVSSTAINLCGNGIALLVSFYYYGFFYSERGTTPGKNMMGLAVVRLGPSPRVSCLRGASREIVGKYLSVLPLGLGLFMALFRKDRRTLHDLICGTMVVRKSPPT